jgi:hypothetical protein
MIFARIISGIGINCVNSNLTILASALDIEKEGLQEYERNRLSQIKQDRKQMTLLSAARSKREEEYQEEEERLPKETEKAIASLRMRELTDRNRKDILSEPTKLMGEFKEEDESENFIGKVDRENASSACALSLIQGYQEVWRDTERCSASRTIGPTMSRNSSTRQLLLRPVLLTMSSLRIRRYVASSLSSSESRELI